MKITAKDVEAMERRVSGAPPFVVGIDPGASTGYAFICNGKLIACESGLPIEIETKVLTLFRASGPRLLVVVEDTRKLRLPKHLRTNHGQMDQGVGQVHAEMRRWEQFCEHHGIACIMQKPHKGIPKKVTHERLKEDFPEFDGRTNQHGRDAAYLAKSQAK